ncbi:hypothetical protein C9374_011240 [Naegleria lovaniensis]|uniref:Uncharacterized protein n=1 Tax=Naegleria lovaniensis TaxID=51637 RepID=A0AA88KWF4_NAELO|nr:uncharacterized protein C9374_011240 [Naegleria lovaniensis]KAG2392515.1 hypothetical protein C9374_011240 [Naegleria lovaniensis]
MVKEASFPSLDELSCSMYSKQQQAVQNSPTSFLSLIKEYSSPGDAISQFLSPFQSTADNTTTNSNNTTTHESLAALFPTSIENINSIANSCFFIVVFSVLMAVIGVIIYKGRSAMKRNHKIMFSLLCVFILVQYFGLVFRLVYNGVSLKVNSFTDLTLVENLYSYQVAVWVSSTLENVLVVSQISTIIIIMAFMMTIFINTVKISGAMTAKTYTILWWFITITTLISSIIFVGLVITLGVVNLLLKTQTIRVNAFPIYLVLFLIYIAIMLLESILFIALGVRLLMVVKKRSLNVSQVNTSMSRTLQQPYYKIVGLIIGMLLSAFLQILAGAVSIATSLYVGYLHIIDYFLQCFGVLVFAIFVLLLYGPLLLDQHHHHQEAHHHQQAQMIMMENEQLPSSARSASSPSPRMSFRKANHEQISNQEILQQDAFRVETVVDDLKQNSN